MNERNEPGRKGQNGRGGVVVVRNNLFELEVDKVVGIERALLLLWWALVEIPVSTSSGENAGGEEDGRHIATGLLGGSRGIPTDSSSSLEYMRQ
jgi:hypothetical protein